MKTYNTIYKKLVSDENDFLGMVAYGVYKKSKIAYIEDLGKGKKKVPEDIDLKEFYRNSQSAPQVEMYKVMAEQIIQKFVVQMAQDEVNEIEKEMTQMKAQMEEMKKEHENRLADEKEAFIKRIEKIKPPKWYVGILQSVLAAFIVLLLYIVAVVHFNLFGLNDSIEKRIVDQNIQKIEEQHPSK